jgi:hypothetical protein
VTIHNADQYMAGVWDWAILDGCFGETKIKPTDIDGFVERNGKFLVLETKQPNVQRVPQGQELTFKALVKRAGAVVIVIFGEQNKPERLKVYSSMYPDGFDVEDPDGQHLRDYVKVWFKRANGK